VTRLRSKILIVAVALILVIALLNPLGMEAR